MAQTSFKTFVLRLLTQAFTIGAGIIVARSLGPAGKGVFTYAATVLTLLVTLGSGASAAVSRQYGREGVPSGIVYAGMLRFFYTVCLPSAAVIALVAIVAHQPILLAPAVAFPLAYINQVSLGFSLADGHVGFANMQSLFTAMLLAAAVAIVCFGFHLGAGYVLTAWVGVIGAVVLYSLTNLRKYRGDPGTRAQRAAAFSAHSSFGLRVSFNQLLGLANYNIDIFIVLIILGHAALGKYSVAVGIGALAWHLSSPLSIASYGSVTRGNAQEAARITVLCVRHALFSVGIACIALALAGPWLLTLVYGNAFSESGRALQLLLPGIIAYCTVPFFSQYFTLQLGKPGINTALIASSTALCAFITLLLIHRFGIAAGAIGTSVSYAAAFFTCAAIFCRYTGAAPSSLIVFDAHDLQQYRALAGWIVSGMRSTYVRRGG